MWRDPDSLVNPEPAPIKCSGITCVTGIFNLLLEIFIFILMKRYGDKLLQNTFSKLLIFKPTPIDLIKILSLMDIFSLIFFGKWIITCSENLPDLPVTIPLVLLASPLIIIASFPTQDNIFKPLLPASFKYLIDTPGWIQSASHPKAESPTDTLWTTDPQLGKRNGLPSESSL